MKIKKNIAISENGFIFDSSTGESFSVNQTGADILIWIQNHLDEDNIIQKIREKYEVEQIIAEKDLNDFIAVLKQFELLLTNEADQ